MFDAIFNNIINALIRDLPMSLRYTIAFFLFLACLIFFNYSFRQKNDTHPIKIGWFALFILALSLSVLYGTI